MRVPSSLSLLAVLALGCNAPAPAPTQLALTHQWSTKAGTSLFAQVSLGAAPEGAADALMGVMPTVAHQLGERCRSHPGAATAGAFALSFSLEAGAAVGPTAEPPSPLGECAIAALEDLVHEHAAEFTKATGARVVLYLEHAPMPG